jgi:hypothetical protein
MDLTAVFKKASLVESGDGNVWQFQFNASREQMSASDLDFINKNQGRSVLIAVEPNFDSDYESPKERKERIEKEKYNSVMADKSKRQAELALDRAEKKIEEPEQPLTINLPGRRTTEHPDFLSDQGARYTTGKNEEGAWGVICTPVDGEPNFIIAALEPGTEVEARNELRKLAETNNLAEVAPVGFGAVYQADERHVIPVMPRAHWDGEPGFGAAKIAMDGTAIGFPDNIVFESAELAQIQVDETAEARNAAFLTYMELNFAPIEPEPDIEEIKAAFHHYQDEDGARYFVCDYDDPDLGYTVYRVFKNKDGEEPCVLDNPPSANTAEIMQMALDEMAAEQGWYAMVPDEEPEVEEAEAPCDPQLTEAQLLSDMRATLEGHAHHLPANDEKFQEWLLQGGCDLLAGTVSEESWTLWKDLHFGAKRETVPEQPEAPAVESPAAESDTTYDPFAEPTSQPAEPPLLSSIIRVGDNFIKQEDQRLRGVEANPAKVKAVHPELSRIVSTAGFTGFLNLNEKYRLVLDASSILSGDLLRPKTDNVPAFVWGVTERAAQIGKELESAIWLGWEALDLDYVMMQRAEATTAGNGEVE